MAYHSTLRQARGSLDDVPFELSELEQLQVELDVANKLIALSGLPTIQLRGRQLLETVKERISKLTDIEHKAEHTDWLDLRRTEEEARL